MSDQPVVVVSLPEIKRLSPGTSIIDPIIDGNLVVNGVIQTDGITVNSNVANPQTDPLLAPSTIWNNSGTIMLGANPLVPATLLTEKIATAIWTPNQLVQVVAGPGPDPLPMSSALTDAERTITFSRVGRQVTAQFAAPILFTTGAAGAGTTYEFADMNLTIPVGYRPSAVFDFSAPLSEMEAIVTVADVAPDLILFSNGGMRLKAAVSGQFWFGDDTYSTNPATQIVSLSWLTSDPSPP